MRSSPAGAVTARSRTGADASRPRRGSDAGVMTAHEATLVGADLRARGLRARARLRRRPSTRASRSGVSATGWYVYGVVDAERAVEAEEGIHVVRVGRLAAVVAQVDLAEYHDLDTRLNDRIWVEEQALRHETVLSRMARAGPVVPL